MSRNRMHEPMPDRLPSGDGKAQALRLAFLRWQCRVRQIMMREQAGRPGPPIMPAVTPEGAGGPLGHVITVMTKTPLHDKTPEMRHIARRTNDPALRREAALRLFSEFYYQRPEEFSDMLTATFLPGSQGAAAIRAAELVRLTFEAYSQRFDIACRVRTLTDENPARQATWWHNLLFNPDLPADTVVLGFVPDWERSSADPTPA